LSKPQIDVTGQGRDALKTLERHRSLSRNRRSDADESYRVEARDCLSGQAHRTAARSLQSRSKRRMMKMEEPGDPPQSTWAASFRT